MMTDQEIQDLIAFIKEKMTQSSSGSRRHYSSSHHYDEENGYQRGVLSLGGSIINMLEKHLEQEENHG